MSTLQQLAGRYQLGEEIGYGGMSEVHLAVDLRLNREVAVKILRTELASDKVFYLRFKREAQNAAGLSHPNIVQVFDTGETVYENANIPYIVMEFVDGETLREILNREGAVDPSTSLHWIAETCDALQYSHAHNIVHRDIKPANIMIDHAGAVKVMDFGIARAITDISLDLTQTSTVIGTARYLSPEQATGKVVDARSDIYALGCVFFELLTGQAPFTADTPVAVAYQHVKEQPPLPSSINPYITPEIDSIVLKSLSKNPENRYQSAAEMREDILAVLSGKRPSAPIIMTDADHAAVTQSTQHSLTNSSAGDYSGDSKRKTYINKFIALLAIVVLLGGAAWGTQLIMNNMNKVLPIHSDDPLQVPEDILNQDPNNAKDNLQRQGFIVTVEYAAGSRCKDGYNRIISTEPPPGDTSADKNVKLIECVLKDSGQKKPVPVPDVRNQTQQEAIDSLKNLSPATIITDHDFSDTIEKDHVIRTDPPAGVNFSPNSTIHVVLSNGKKPQTLPDMVGTKISETKPLLEKMGIRVTVSSKEGLAPPGQILSSSASTGADASNVKLVNLEVSTGQAVMPDLSNMNVNDARSLIRSLGFKGKIVETASSGLDGLFAGTNKILHQVPDKNNVLHYNDTVTLTYKN